jgi:hypothetical protein
MALGGALLAGPAERPGLALVATLLVAPVMILAATPLRRGLKRATVGMLGWSWLVAGFTFAGMPGDPGLAAPAPSGWETSAAAAAETLVGALSVPGALLGAVIFALAGAAFGIVLAARHAALAAAAALPWAACTSAALSLVGNGSLAKYPALIAAAALAAVFVARRSGAGDSTAPRLAAPPRALPSP